MTPPHAALPPGLDELLKALRAAGLPVGVREVLRLRRVFELGPALDQEREPEAQVRRILAAALVHSPEEREVFEPVYRAWNERWAQWDSTGDVWRELPEPRRRQRAIARSAPAAWRWISLVILLTAVALLLPPPRPQPPARAPVVDNSGVPPPPAMADFRILPPGDVPTTYDAWIPSFEITHAQREPVALFVFVGSACLVTAAGLFWWNVRKHHRSPPLSAELAGRPPRRLPYLPLPDAGPQLLDPDAARTLIWGVGRHRTEDLTPEIDLERTADATARGGGIPELCHVPEQQLREVWLWVDGAADDSALEQYAEEIATSLEQAGLPARVAAFDGYPVELEWDEGQRFRPEELEGHRQTALVAVMTDGALLVRHEREEVASLLRALATWERLVFVDFSDGPELAALARRAGIPCTAPEDLPYFFGLGTGRGRTRGADPGELRAWSVALALAPRATGRADAYALRHELGLGLSPLELRRLEPAAVVGGRLAWEECRAAEVRWLHDSQDDTGTLGKALDYWQQRLAEEDRRRSARRGLSDWEESPERRYLAMERGFLRLWRDPVGAADELGELAEVDEKLAVEIRERLLGYVSEDRDRLGDERVPIGWQLKDLPAAVRQRLGDLGLDVGRGKQRQPGRLALALGALVGVGLALLAHGLTQIGNGPEAEPSFDTGTEPPREATDAFQEIVAVGEDEWVAYAETPRAMGEELAGQALRRGDQVRVLWTKNEGQPCVSGEGEARIWRCGRQTTIRLATEWPRRRVAVVALSAEDRAVQDLAQTLLDSGSADVVVLGRNANTLLPDLAGGTYLDKAELLWIGGQTGVNPALSERFGGKWAILRVQTAGALEQWLRALARPTPVSEIDVAIAAVSQGDEDLLLHYCPFLRAVHQPTQMPFVWVCGGGFQMGSEDDDPDAQENEKPAHEVELTGFWIGEREVSNAEYQWLKPDHRGENKLPTVNVTWFDSRDYCGYLGAEYGLPTEAQWEYAARGNTGRRYPWGDDEPDAERAVFGRDLSASPEAVDTLPLGAGPFGTLHQAGNVWEWVYDCFDDGLYRKRADRDVESNPRVGNDETCSTTPFRVLRGGAYWDVPRGLRSAFRGRLGPVNWGRSFGFRCVRSPRRQP